MILKFETWHTESLCQHSPSIEALKARRRGDSSAADRREEIRGILPKPRALRSGLAGAALTLERKSAAPPYGLRTGGAATGVGAAASLAAVSSGWLGACSSTGVKSAGTAPDVVGTGAGSAVPFAAAVGHILAA